MFFIEILVAIYLLGSFIHFQVNKKRTEYRTSRIAEYIGTSEELKKTIAMGLYLRFRTEKEDYQPTIRDNAIFIKQDPYDFEQFVAEIIQSVYGGSVLVTPTVGDHGVDFEHHHEEEIYLGQVKCYKDPVSYEPIAILHSNMIKVGAKGGYLVTTSCFTDEAINYAKDTNIELISGIQLVELWITRLQGNEAEIKQLIPEYAD